jgi:RNA polymerase sigma factor (sigma-70 family)
MSKLEEDQLARWIVGPAAENETGSQKAEFVFASQQAWPRVLAHTRRELSNLPFSSAEITSLAIEVWEGVLRSVWKTLQHSSRSDAVRDLENYLIGTFFHRLNHRLRQNRRRNSVVEFVAPEKLIELPGRSLRGDDCVARIDQQIQLKQIIAMMDQTARRAVIAKARGFSWSEIAKTFQIEEQNLIMRVQYAIRKLRRKMAGSKERADRIRQRRDRGTAS